MDAEAVSRCVLKSSLCRSLTYGQPLNAVSFKPRGLVILLNATPEVECRLLDSCFRRLLERRKTYFPELRIILNGNRLNYFPFFFSFLPSFLCVFM